MSIDIRISYVAAILMVVLLLFMVFGYDMITEYRLEKLQEKIEAYNFESGVVVDSMISNKQNFYLELEHDTGADKMNVIYKVSADTWKDSRNGDVLETNEELIPYKILKNKE